MSAGDSTCKVCSAPTLYGRHLKGEVCGGARATNAELSELYAAMDAINMRPADIVRNLDVPKGKGTKTIRVKFLSELPSEKVRELTQMCRDFAAKHGKGGAS